MTEHVCSRGHNPDWIMELDWKVQKEHWCI